MTSILIVCGSDEGQAEKVAQYVADLATERGHEVDLVTGQRAIESADPSNYDATIVGASIHVGKHQPYVVEFARRYADSLSAGPSAFFEVCLSAASDEPERQAEARRYVDEFVEETGWEPDEVGVFAGAIRYSQYGFLKRMLMKRIAKDATGDTDTSRDYEYTDWDDVTAFAESFLEVVEAGDTDAVVEPTA